VTEFVLAFTPCECFVREAALPFGGRCEHSWTVYYGSAADHPA
jgi:hypothetical protein